jgi:hypothetical protein
MPATEPIITRTAFTDDTGDGVSGDIWNSTLIGTSLYDPIDTLAQLFTQGRVYDVSAYGAVGDDATDDTAAIQAAIDAADANAGGGVVYFPPSIYRTTAPLQWGSNGTRLVGATQRASTIHGDHVGPIVQGDGTRRLACAIQHLALLGESGTTVDILELNDIDLSYFEDVFISTCTGKGVDCEGAIGSTRNTFVNVTITAAGTGMWFGAVSSSARVISGEIQNCTTGIDIDHASSANNIVLSGVIIESTVASAIGIRVNGLDAVLIGNRLELSGGSTTGVELTASSDSCKLFGNYYTSVTTAVSIAGATHHILDGDGLSRELRWSGDQRLSGSAATLWVDDTANGVAAIARTMSGVDLSVTSMNNSTLQHGAAVKFMSTDPAFTTENPKLLAGVFPRATESYGADTDGGMAIDLATTPDNPGATSTPTVRATLDENGNLNVGTTVAGSSAAGVVTIANGTQGAALANAVQLASEDLSAGNTTLSMRTEGSGAVVTGTPAAATGAIAIVVNGTVRYLTFSNSAPT